MSRSTPEGEVICWPFFGWVKVDSRLRQDGDCLIGEGRSLNYDGNGMLTKDTGWQETGVRVRLA